MHFCIDYLILILGLFKSIDSAIIEWTTGNNSTSVGTAAITDGVSVHNGIGHAAEYSVVCTIQVENWTKYPLIDPESHINGGILQSPPTIVQPGKREMFVAHKKSYSFSGTYGTASWLISAMDRRAVVMWSCPYNFNHHSNWLAVGLTTMNHTTHQDWFDQMYYGTSGKGINFDLGEYYYHTRTISTNDGKFEITGIMGTSHHAQARIIVRPLYEEDLAPPEKRKVIKNRK